MRNVFSFPSHDFFLQLITMASSSSSTTVSLQKRTYLPPQPLPSAIKKMPTQIPLYHQVFLFQPAPIPNLPPMEIDINNKIVLHHYYFMKGFMRTVTQEENDEGL